MLILNVYLEKLLKGPVRFFFLLAVICKLFLKFILDSNPSLSSKSKLFGGVIKHQMRP